MSKLKWMKWVFFLLPMVISMGECQFFSFCKGSPFDPDEPELITYADIRIDYYRPDGVQLKIDCTRLCRSWAGYSCEDMVKVEEGHYMKSEHVWVNSRFYKNMDRAHYMRVYDGGNDVADGIFVNGILITNRKNTPNGPLAYFWLKEDGTPLQ